MALAVYGIEEDQADTILLNDLAESWIRRQRFKAQLIAIEIARLSAGKSAGPGRAGRVKPEAFLAAAGIEISE